MGRFRAFSRDLQAVVPFLAAGTWLALWEASWVALTGRIRFSSLHEVLGLVVTSWLVLTGGCVCLGVACRGLLTLGVEPSASWEGAGRRVPKRHVPSQAARQAGRVGSALAIGVAPAAGWLLWELSSGRRLRDAPVRGAAVVAGAVLAAWVAAWIGRRVARVLWAGTRVQRRRGAAVSLVASLACHAADALVLPRLYFPLHVAWAVGAGGLAILAFSLLWPLPREGRAAPRWLAALAGAAIASATLTGVRASSTLRFMAEQSAPVQGKLLAAVRALDPHRNPPLHAVASVDDAVRAPRESLPPAVPSGELRGRDVLLITVDALRADRLSAYGGRGVAPAMDALARDGVVFGRAYTPAPHTSYALASLFTASFARARVQLGVSQQARSTLPELLARHAGYHTAAFFPPAVFYVDATHFDGLRERRFGFEQVHMDDASAAVRAEQLERFVAQAPSQPLFVWVHLFEPHEPYEPPAGLARGDGAEARYDGEVRAADRAVGAMVETFRHHRPTSLVILTADHGEELGDHGGAYHGTTLFDEQVRVPLIWSAPDVWEPRRIARPAELVDVGTTLLSMLGVPGDARMHGEDLSAAFQGASDARGVAVAQLPDASMVCDGRYKAICRRGERDCALFDLEHDPQERLNLAGRDEPVVERLQASLAQWRQRIADREQRRDAAAEWSRVLARAKLGDRSVGPRLVRFLADPDVTRRVRATRALAAIEYVRGLPALRRAARADSDARVRAEAALAMLALGDATAIDTVRARLGHPDTTRAWRRRAAWQLAQHDAADGAGVLQAWASDEDAPFDARRKAVRALGTLGSRDAVPVLESLLDEPSLTVAAARALGVIGGKHSARILAQRIPREPYPLARQAQLDALALIDAAHAARIEARATAATRRRAPATARSTNDASSLVRGASARRRARRRRGATAPH